MRQVRSPEENWDYIYSKEINTVWGKEIPDITTRNLVSELIKSFSEKKINVLDIGCGNGRNSRIFQDISGYDIRYQGIDFSAKAIEYCKKKHTFGNFQWADITKKMDLPEEKFQIILDYGCFHSIHPDERQRYRDNILAYSEAGTFLIIGAWYGEDNAYRSNPDFVPYGILSEWFVSKTEFAELFSNTFRIINHFIDKAPPHDINNGMLFVLMMRER